ncbi:hypothetical protein [Mycolicibacterium iranicum]|uniref:Uncharacterized protein n=1 Tax=Mycolicibacterium iranicum TaxID=912594 RepID=A0A178LDQ7_MYCIR|nr:hypothetical protein [Mycolicibacterium iranicum]OAN28598.1 hypothetical protein A4X20_10395 [Mycolicibacterium iranicum]
MLTIPPFVWRHGAVLRALIVGGAAGVCTGVLAWLDSGFWFAGVIVLLVVGACYGTWMARRMVRYWPESVALSGGDRVEVARAARRGVPLADGRLADAVAAYSRGMHAAAEDARMLRWVIVVVLAVGVGVAVWDGFFGSWGNFIASAGYLLALFAEVFWWPGRKKALLANSVRAAAFRR